MRQIWFLLDVFLAMALLTLSHSRYDPLLDGRRQTHVLALERLGLESLVRLPVVTRPPPFVPSSLRAGLAGKRLRDSVVGTLRG